MSSKSKSKSKSQEKGTIVLRQAEPKYNFVGRKLPKKSDPSDTKQSKTSETTETTASNFQNNASLNSSYSKKPVAVVEGSCQPPNNGSLPQQGAMPSNPRPGDQREGLGSDNRTKSPTFNPGEKCVNTNSAETLTHADTRSLPSLSGTKALNIPLQSVIEDSAAAVALSNITKSLSLADRISEVEKERDKLKMDLDVQLQVNSELKRLLVASVGEDLGDRVQRLVRDRAQLSFDIGGFSKKMREDYEHLDKVSIQADMWRSKYLASRVMIEELGNARAFYSLQCHDGQDALQQLLNERHELRTNLLDTYKVLQQVKGAFDPLNSHRSFSLPSTNVLDLSRSCQQLAEAVRFRLLPSHVTSSLSTEIDVDLWENSVTRAEQYAHELLSRPSEPPGSLKSGSSHLLPIAGGSTSSHCPSSHLISRYHPHARHDNLTFTCCKCKGEISVV